jgi:hypothetical protein
MTAIAKNQSMNRLIARTTVPLTSASLMTGIVGRSGKNHWESAECQTPAWPSCSHD